MTRDILETIDRFWEARIAGDRAAVQSFVAEGATYEMVGAKAFAAKSKVGPAPAGPAADQLIDDFQLREVRRTDAIVDGRKAAITIQVEVCYRGGPPVTTEACGLWEFDSSGKIKSLREFVDTAVIGRMMATGA
jgi:ketosteroid isomerase-like protein